MIAAHPDDETLGCGGTIARLAAEEHEVAVLPLTDGVQSRYGSDPKKVDSILAAVNARFDAFHAAMRALGAQRCALQLPLPLFPDQRLDVQPSLWIANAISEVIAWLQPSVVYTHSATDLNQDHVAVHRATLIATRPVPGCPVREVYAYEVPSATEWGFGQFGAFTPDTFVDITLFDRQKADALACYADELRDAPHPRSLRMIQALNRLRGAAVGVDTAEAFETVRRLVR